MALITGELGKHVLFVDKFVTQKSHFDGEDILEKIIFISYTKIVTLCMFPIVPSNQQKVGC